MSKTIRVAKNGLCIVHLRWRLIAQALVQTLMVVEVEVVMQSRFQLWDRVILHEVDVLVLDRAPQALDENVVQGSAPAVHAHLDAGSLQDADELDGRELRTLIGVEDSRHSLFQCLPQRDPTEETIHSVRQLPSQNVAAPAANR